MHATTTLSDAKTLFRHGFIAAAIDLLELTVDDAPDDGAIWELLGVIYLIEGSTKKAVGALEKAAALRALSLGGNLALAECYRRTQSPGMASAVYLELARKDRRAAGDQVVSKAPGRWIRPRGKVRIEPAAKNRGTT